MRSKSVGMLLAALSVTCVVFAQEKTAVRFAATTQNVSGAGESIKINLSSWSSDTQRDEFVAAWTLTANAAAPPGGRGGRGGARGAAGTRGARGARGGGAAPEAAAATPAVAQAADVPVDPDAVDADDPAFRFGRGSARDRGDAPPQTPESSLSATLKKAPTISVLWTS